MGHDHDHSHGTGDRGRLRLAAALTGAFMVAEVVGGLLSGSLALLSDAAHMLTDAVALAGAWLAFLVADRPADRQRPFGYARFPVLAAFANGVVLLVIVAWIGVEAIQRLLDPTVVVTGTMAAIAALGLAVNIAVFAILHGGSRGNLNLRGALVHVLGDLLGSAAALIGAGVIWLTGWTPIDPLLSLLVAALVARSAWFVVKRSAHVLLEGKPDAIDPDQVAAAITAEIPAVTGVHSVRAWSLDPERPLVSLHAAAAAEADSDAAVSQVKELVARRFGAAETLVQMEFGPACPDGAGAPG